MQPGIHGALVGAFAACGDAKGIEEELDVAFCSLFPVALLEGLGKFQKGLQTSCLGNYEVSEVG